MFSWSRGRSRFRASDTACPADTERLGDIHRSPGLDGNQPRRAQVDSLSFSHDQRRTKGGRSMAEPATKVPTKTEEKPIERPTALEAWRPFESLRRQIDRIFEDFDQDPWRLPFRRSIFDVEPFWRRELAWGPSPTVVSLRRTMPMRSWPSCQEWTRRASK